MIRKALLNLEGAQRHLERAVQQTYPVGTPCRFRRSPRVVPVEVKVVSHSNGTCLVVRNEDTNKVYKVDGTSRRLERVTA